MNAIKVIIPYRWEGMWVFDDAKVDLDKEPFVSGADDIIDLLVADIPDAADGFRLIFSSTPFPGFQVEFEWQREEHGGNWYHIASLDKEGWLCPALFKYFDEAPKSIFAKVEPRDKG
ncbi:MAG: hypothetical protein QM496_11805 [Verrucomicrobiota bacterium]